MSNLSRAIDAVILASHCQQRWLKEGHPPFFIEVDGVSQPNSIAAGLRHYGGPCAGLDLWIAVRAMEMVARAVVEVPVVGELDRGGVGS